MKNNAITFRWKSGQNLQCVCLSSFQLELTEKSLKFDIADSVVLFMHEKRSLNVLLSYTERAQSVCNRRRHFGLFHRKDAIVYSHNSNVTHAKKKKKWIAWPWYAEQKISIDCLSASNFNSNLTIEHTVDPIPLYVVCCGQFRYFPLEYLWKECFSRTALFWAFANIMS